EWQSAGVIPAANGQGQWIVGVDKNGHIHSISTTSQAEDVTDRYGLVGQTVHEVASPSKIETAFRLDAQIAVADGTNVVRYDLALASLTAGDGRVAGIGGGAVHVFDLSSGSDTSYAIDDAAFVAFDGSGKLVAATHQALLTEDGSGGLTTLFDLSDSDVH